MLTYTLTKENMEILNSAIKEKNKLSPLNYFSEKDFSENDTTQLIKMGLFDLSGNIEKALKPSINILSKPNAVAKLTFTGGAGVFEHNINYDDRFQKHVSLTVTPKDCIIDDEADIKSIIDILKDFIGVSNLKSINVSGKYNISESLVIASILDIERRNSLRAFVDEVPVMQNSYNVNMIWRITNSTSSSIQWFVSIINDIIGKHDTLSLLQIQEGVNGLLEKGVLVKTGEQYQMTGEMAQLSSRMIIIDNILSAQITKYDSDKKIVGSGFTCIQSGVHDLLFVDFDGSEIMFETISSVDLLDYLERFLDCNANFSD